MVLLPATSTDKMVVVSSDNLNLSHGAVGQYLNELWFTKVRYRSYTLLVSSAMVIRIPRLSPQRIISLVVLIPNED